MSIKPQVLAEIGRGQRRELLQALRRAGGDGCGVKELAARFGLSYMGVKQHFVRLEREGYIEGRRKHKPVGRPELIYRLTPRGHDVLGGPLLGVGATTVESNGVVNNAGSTTRLHGGSQLVIQLLEAVRQTYGATAPDKLLFTLYQRCAEDYRAKLPAANSTSLAERASGLARLRESDGYVCSLDPAAGSPFHSGNGNGARHAASTLRVVEVSTPLADLLPRFPILTRLESELFERVLLCPVQRTDESNADGYRCVYYLGR
ncbi:MAG: helix-turn-helix transcriptional regulator [Verrucomicrobia bacterium]|nr:helix-turn-helix transcriptional regulator [Verrucomicrobiota bacterium]